MSTQWFNKSLTDLLYVIENEDVNLEAIINAFYQRIEDRDQNVQAWQYLITKESYLNQYHSHEQFYKKSVLKGLPFAVKDVIDTAGIETSMGSKIHIGRIPQMDASIVTAIKQAGGIIIGKTVTTEFAYFKSGKTKNPHDINRTPGGSSSGSAAAVADFMVPFALGTQTAASVIRPAAYCGCAAYVASHDEFSLRNIQPLAQSLDGLGMFANQFSDIALMRNVMQLRTTAQKENIHPNFKFKVAVCTGEVLGEIEPEMRNAFDELLRQFKQQSIELLTFSNEIDLKALEQCHIQIMAYEVARNLQFEYQTGMLDSFLTELIEKGLAITYENYLHNLKNVAEIKSKYHTWMKSHDISFVVAPAASGIAPLGLEKTGQPFMSRPWQVMGLPVTTFPMSYFQKMPLGVQLIGLYKQDDELLAMSQFIQQFIDYQSMRES